MDEMTGKIILRVAITIVSGILIAVGMRFVLKHFDIKKSDKIHRRFLGRLFNLIIFLVCLLIVFDFVYPGMKIQSIFLKGSALVVAIVGFAAQPAISDLICGFLISINKPFEIGDRIVIEGMNAGVVEDITLRHTIIRIYDGLRVMVPNSVLNSKTVINTSYRVDRRGIHLEFSVSYDTDIQLSMDVIRDCVVDSPYTLPVETNGILEDSGPVYFLKYGESALILETTIWVLKETSSETAITDVNMRVKKAFDKFGIEIPYGFINVVQRENTSAEVSADVVRERKGLPSKRNYRTDTVAMKVGGDYFDKVMDTVRLFAKRQSLDKKNTMQMELMTEELMQLMGSFAEERNARFWVDGNALKYRLHMRFSSSMGNEDYKRLLSFSSSGKNEAVNSLSGRIAEKVLLGMRRTNDTASRDGEYEWSLSESGQKDDLGESIIASIADDIKVSVTKERVDLVVVRTIG